MLHRLEIIPGRQTPDNLSLLESMQLILNQDEYDHLLPWEKPKCRQPEMKSPPLSSNAAIRQQK